MTSNPFVEALQDAELRRRSFLQLATAGGVASLLLNRPALGVPAWIQQAQEKAIAGRAKRCVFVYLQGGPSHIDTFDPKPGQETGGEFKAIESSVSGIRISEHFPQLAKEMKDVAIIRSMTSKEGNHDRGRYLVHSGYAPQAAVSHPGIGGILSHEIGNEKLDLPAFVAIGGSGMTGGYLGSRHSPLSLPKATGKIEDLTLADGVSKERFEARRKLLRDLDTRFERKSGAAVVEPHAEVYDRAERLMKSPLLAAFDITKEDDKVREAYGKEEFGQACLLARRLMESGVACVEVRLDGWDTHQNNFVQVERLSHLLDAGLSQLLRDLRSRGMLNETMVLCFGEFGRTPRIRDGGRDHHPRAWSALLAGGGVKGGQVIGATDETGTTVKDHPVTIPDLFFSIAKGFGIDPTQVNFAGPRPIRLVDKEGVAVAGLFA